MIPCPVCGEQTFAIDGWDLAKGKGRRRKRECGYCGHLVYTLEVIEEKRNDDHVETTKSSKSSVHRTVSQRKKARPFNVSEMYIALRVRQGLAEVDGDAAAEGNQGSGLVP